MLPSAGYILAGLLGVAANAMAQQPAAIVVSPEKCEFPAQAADTPGVPQTLTLSNRGSTTVLLRGVLVSGIDFSQTTDCGEKLEAGAICTVSITFKPASTGDRLGALQLNWAGAGSPRTVPLTGRGQ